MSSPDGAGPGGGASRSDAATHEDDGTELDLHQSQRLESLGQLAGGVAHDFNNLLGAIINYAHFVGEEINAAAAGHTDRDWAAVGRDVVQIQRGTERALALTRQLLAFARREVVHPEVLDLNAVVAGVDQLLRRTIGNHVELEIELEAGLHPIKADPGQIEQILVNLAVNARDAMPGGGILKIETASTFVVDPRAQSDRRFSVGRYVRLRCSDTGSGMPREVIERAFEPFFTTKPKGEGTGLGLATVYGIVTQAGGHLHLDSEAGRGTTVTAVFPVAEPDVNQPEERPVEVIDAPTGGGRRVLLVEDEPLMRDVTSRILERNGYEVIATTNGLDALAAAVSDEEAIHLLLTDVVMPKMFGSELAARMQALRPGIRVLFMSGYAQATNGQEGSLAPGVTLLEKPFSEAALLAKVREVLDVHV